MARLDFEINKTGGTLVSFHFEYNDYLACEGLMDPKEKILQTKKQNEESRKAQAEPVGPQTALPEGKNGELDCEELDDLEVEAGRFRFENVLKSMVARLELYNNLAPVYDYARHQAKGGGEGKKRTKKDTKE